MVKKTSLGCAKKLKIGGLCGEANAWGKEHLCEKCTNKWKAKWNFEDSQRRR